MTYPVLVPNLKGLKSALEAGVDHVAIFTAASESFCRKNTNCSVKESLQRFTDVFKVHKTSLQLISLKPRTFKLHSTSVIRVSSYKGQLVKILAEIEVTH